MIVVICICSVSYVLVPFPRLYCYWFIALLCNLVLLLFIVHLFCAKNKSSISLSILTLMHP